MRQRQLPRRETTTVLTASESKMQYKWELVLYDCVLNQTQHR